MEWILCPFSVPMSLVNRLLINVPIPLDTAVQYALKDCIHGLSLSLCFACQMYL